MKRNKIISKYFNEIGEKVSSAICIHEPKFVLNNINDFINNDFFTYEYSPFIFTSKATAPLIFIMEITSDEYIIIKNNNGEMINLTTDVPITAPLLESKNLFFFRAIPNKLNETKIFSSLIKLTPRSTLFSLPLIIFALLLPLYSNLFNSRLVYSESIISLLYISFIFIFVLGIEFFIKHVIHERNTHKIKFNISILNRYFISLLKHSTCKSPAIKVRTAETSIMQVWELRPQITYDIGLAILFSLCILAMLGPYSILLLLYYAGLIFLCVQVRFNAYQNMIKANSINYEKSAMYHSFELKRQKIKFLNETHFTQYVNTKNSEDEKVKLKLSEANHHWLEIIKTNSFLSMMIMYVACYFAVGNGSLSLASIIAMLIINGRLSGAITGAINRIFMMKTHLFHIKTSLTQLTTKTAVKFKDNGVLIQATNSFNALNLNIVLNNNKQVNDINIAANKGDFIGITGASGSGKTSLINALCGISQGHSGEITINDVKLDEISSLYFQQKVAYYSGISPYLNGSLRDKFNLHGVFDNATMIRLIKRCCPHLNISKEILEDILIADLPISTGEKQKLMLAISLMKRPEIIFLDEATSFLPTKDALAFITLIKKEFKLENTIIFFSTHDLGLSALFTQQITLTPQGTYIKMMPEIPTPQKNEIVIPKISLANNNHQ